jgi:hypothetical protein
VEQSLFFSYKKSVKTNIHLVYLILLLIVAGAAYGDDSTSQEQSNSTNNSYIDSRSYRCTAQDGSYSFFVRSSEPCPHESDSRKPMVVMRAQPSEAYLAAQARIDKSDREAREFKKTMVRQMPSTRHEWRLAKIHSGFKIKRDVLVKLLIKQQ